MANKDYLRPVSIGIQTNPDQGVSAESPNLDRVFSRWAGYMDTEAPEIGFQCGACQQRWAGRPMGLQPLFHMEAGGVPRFTGLQAVDRMPHCPRCGSLNCTWIVSPDGIQQFEAEMRRRCSTPRYIRGPVKG